MSKLPPSQDNPLDLLVYRVADPWYGWLRRTGHTPNMLTTYSFVSGLLAVRCLWQWSHALFVLFSVLGYVFDCMDGQFARIR